VTAEVGRISKSCTKVKGLIEIIFIVIGVGVKNDPMANYF